MSHPEMETSAFGHQLYYYKTYNLSEKLFLKKNKQTNKEKNN